jgi:hypothetical protein
MATQHNARATEPPKGEAWSALVEVILDPGTRKFHFETSDLPLDPATNELTFHNYDHPGYVITFRLKEPNFGYAFPDDLDEALFSVDRPICPDTRGQWAQFKAKAVSDGGKSLVVRNHNKDKVRFGYTLRVTDDKGASFWNLDPIGSNENGSFKGRF